MGNRCSTRAHLRNNDEDDLDSKGEPRRTDSKPGYESDDYVETTIEYYADEEEDVVVGGPGNSNTNAAAAAANGGGPAAQDGPQVKTPTAEGSGQSRALPNAKPGELEDDLPADQRHTYKVVEEGLKDACQELGITADWLVDKMIPDDFDTHFSSTFTFFQIRECFIRLVKNELNTNSMVEEWSSDPAKGLAFSSFQRHANNLSELITDAKANKSPIMKSWVRRGVDVREYKGKDVVMLHKNATEMEMMIAANSRRLMPFDDPDFRKELGNELKVLESWTKGEDKWTLAQVREYCNIIYDTLNVGEVDYIEQEIAKYSTCWGPPNRLAAHVLALTGAGIDALYEMYYEICKSHDFEDAEINNPYDLEEKLLYAEILGKDQKGKTVSNINMLPSSGCPFKMWQHLLLKLASIRGNTHVSPARLDSKTLEYKFNLNKTANAETLKILKGNPGGIKEVQRQIKKNMKKAVNQNFTLDKLKIKKLMLTERGLTPTFCINSFEDMLEFLVLVCVCGVCVRVFVRACVHVDVCV